MGKPTARLKSLTPDAAKRAIYIDFEGVGPSKGQGAPPRPSLLGVLCSNRYIAHLLEEKLGVIANGVAGFKENKIESRVLSLDLDSLIAELCERACRENRVILYYSRHEESVIAEHCQMEIYEIFQQCSENAKLLIDAWAAKRPVQRKEHNNTLDDYCTMAGLEKMRPVPPVGGAAKAIRRLRRACEQAQRWSRLDPVDQELARKLLVYNLADCDLLARLTLKAVNARQ